MLDPVVAKLIEIQGREGISNAAFARRLGVDPSMWHLARRGERRPGRKMLKGALQTFPEVAMLVAVALTISHDSVADTPEKVPA